MEKEKVKFLDSIFMKIFISKNKNYFSIGIVFLLFNFLNHLEIVLFKNSAMDILNIINIYALLTVFFNLYSLSKNKIRYIEENKLKHLKKEDLKKYQVMMDELLK